MSANSTDPDMGRRLRELEAAVYNLQRERRPAPSTLDNVKTGTVAGFLVAFVPQGWLLLDGQTVDPAVHPALAAFLTGAGLSLTLPDYRNRFVVGAGATYTSSSTGGSADAIAVSHTHAMNLRSTAAEASGHGIPVDGSFTNRARVDGSGDVTASAGSSGTNANLPPYRGLYWMIRT